MQLLVQHTEQGGSAAKAHKSGGSASAAPDATPTEVDLLEGLIIKNLYHPVTVAGRRGSFNLDIEADCTVLELKQRICDLLEVTVKLPDGFSEVVDIPDPEDVKIKIGRLKRTLADHEGQLTLRELGLRPGERVDARRNDPAPAQRPGGGAPNAANSKPLRPLADLPRWKIAQDREKFDLLLSLQGLQREVAAEASSVLQLLSTNEEIQQEVLSLGGAGEGGPPLANFFAEDLKMSLYALEIAD